MRLDKGLDSYHDDLMPEENDVFIEFDGNRFLGLDKASVKRRQQEKTKRAQIESETRSKEAESATKMAEAQSKIIESQIAADSNKKNYTPWIIGGSVVILIIIAVIVYIIIKKKKS